MFKFIAGVDRLGFLQSFGSLWIYFSRSFTKKWRIWYECLGFWYNREIKGIQIPKDRSLNLKPPPSWYPTKLNIKLCLTFFLDLLGKIEVFKLDFLGVKRHSHLFVFVAYSHSRIEFIPRCRDINALTDHLAVLYHEKGSLQAVYTYTDIIAHFQLLWRSYSADLNWLVFYFALVEK